MTTKHQNKSKSNKNNCRLSSKSRNLKEKGLSLVLSSSDVLCGRGQAALSHAGNVKYRKMVSAHKKSYAEADRSEKGKIAKQVIDEIALKGGRFVEKVEQVGNDKYRTVSKDRALTKTKQAFRDNQLDVPLRMPDTTKKKKNSKSSEGANRGGEKMKSSTARRQPSTTKKTKKKSVAALKYDLMLSAASKLSLSLTEATTSKKKHFTTAIRTTNKHSKKNDSVPPFLKTLEFDDRNLHAEDLITDKANTRDKCENPQLLAVLQDNRELRVRVVGDFGDSLLFPNDGGEETIRQKMTAVLQDNRELRVRIVGDFGDSLLFPNDGGEETISQKMAATQAKSMPPKKRRPSYFSNKSIPLKKRRPSYTNRKWPPQELQNENTLKSPLCINSKQADRVTLAAASPPELPPSLGMVAESHNQNFADGSIVMNDRNFVDDSYSIMSFRSRHEDLFDEGSTKYDEQEAKQLQPPSPTPEDETRDPKDLKNLKMEQINKKLRSLYGSKVVPKGSTLPPKPLSKEQINEKLRILYRSKVVPKGSTILPNPFPARVSPFCIQELVDTSPGCSPSPALEGFSVNMAAMSPDFSMSPIRTTAAYMSPSSSPLPSPERLFPGVNAIYSPAATTPAAVYTQDSIEAGGGVPATPHHHEEEETDADHLLFKNSIDTEGQTSTKVEVHRPNLSETSEQGSIHVHYHEHSHEDHDHQPATIEGVNCPNNACGSPRSPMQLGPDGQMNCKVHQQREAALLQEESTGNLNLLIDGGSTIGPPALPVLGAKQNLSPSVQFERPVYLRPRPGCHLFDIF